MLSWPPTVRIFLGAEPTDMRKGFDSLAHLVESALTLDPLSARAWRLWPVLVWLVFCNMYVREVSIPSSL